MADVASRWQKQACILLICYTFVISPGKIQSFIIGFYCWIRRHVFENLESSPDLYQQREKSEKGA